MPRLTDIDGLWRKGCKGSAAAWPGPAPSRSTSGSAVFFPRKKLTASLPKSRRGLLHIRRHLPRGKKFPPGTNSSVPSAMIRSLNPNVFPCRCFFRSARGTANLLHADRRLAKASKGKEEPRPVKAGRGFFVISSSGVQREQKSSR